MIFRTLDKTTEKKVAVAMLLIALGLIFLIVGITWPRHPASAALAGTDWNDFLHGLFIGVAIGLEASGVVLAISAAAAKRASKL